MSATHIRYCECGATREVPRALRVASCVRCGRALVHSPDAFEPIPTATLVATATLASQLLGALAFALALAWIVKAGDRGTVIVAMLGFGAACVFAGGSAQRGSIAALACCGLVDIAVAIACLANAVVVYGFVHAPAARLSPWLAAHLEPVVAGVGVVAAVAAISVIAAVPQARRVRAVLASR